VVRYGRGETRGAMFLLLRGIDEFFELDRCGRRDAYLNLLMSHSNALEASRESAWGATKSRNSFTSLSHPSFSLFVYK